MNDYGGQKIAVLGGGRSGVAAARLARSAGAEVEVFDDGDAAVTAGSFAALRAEGVACFGGGEAVARGGFSLAVASPGIDPRRPLVAGFRERGVEVVGEIEFAWRQTGLPVVGVTGTNGKTTTTELVAASLNAGGVRAVACGNYGLPLSEVVTGGCDHEVLVAEVSSFQLELIDRFRPAVAVWTNFAPDHLDRYDGVEDYLRAKLRVFENQTAGDLAVVRSGEPVGELQARTVTFSAFEEGADYRFEGGVIHGPGGVAIGFGSTRLRGRHNAENVMAAAAAAAEFGVGPGEIEVVLETYEAPRHRCELCGVAGGVEYINDSKATNVHALESALRSLDRGLVLIAGGKDKGLDYRGLAGVVAERARAVVLIGETAEAMEVAWGGGVEVVRAGSVGEAVKVASGLARSGDVVLFSPGTSSFDMFSGYEERGDAFCAAVADTIL